MNKTIQWSQTSIDGKADSTIEQQPESKIKLIDTVKVIKPVESIKSIPQKQSSKPVQSNDKLKLNAGNKFKKKQKKWLLHIYPLAGQ